MTFAEVILWGTKIGTVALPDDSHIATFRYDNDFLNSGIEVSPLAMPLSTRQYSFAGLSAESFHGLPGLLADSLPDRFGNAIIDQWLASQGRTPESFNAVERLCYTGQRGMGALEFRPVTGPKYNESEKINVDSLVRLASDILTQRNELHLSADNQVMQQIMQVGTSAGGARAKAVIAWNEETNDIRSGQIEAGTGYDYWIIKFDGIRGNGDHDVKDPPTYTRIEYAYHLMAKAVGIKMNECRLYRENGLFHFMTKRFDRETGSGRKIHMQTLGAMAHYDFNDETATSYEMAAGVLRKLYLPYEDMEQLCLRMIFNMLTKNCDDHVKNISFLMNRKGEWSLAPAYDLTYAYNPTNRWLRAHQMSVNQKRSDITEKDMIACAAAMDISKTKCRQMIHTVEDVVAEFTAFAQKAELPSSVAEHLNGELKSRN
ncbi:MAG: type II toxin-antitoxin system HipA family toxin [Ruminococcus sp.]|uniref:type II toxin-antitoxin system HipA family toxin n=1 Tax=Ruminococcus sp. TaxID=41978 RepID=UPI002873486A|nr:type II toxin-antitoxin system HipA family toxin [Ruminococcus sp.]MBQ3285166.1 type II toxin-antitoxin system HipA family toxin [Ruminococcus sp.]